MKFAKFKHQLVDSIPEKLQAGTLYLTPEGDVAGHLCACGCGREVITPISPTDWSVLIDHHGVTLDPSIGNWSFPCRSHYFIRDGKVVWARSMPNMAIAQGRQRNKASKLSYYRQLNEDSARHQEHPGETQPPVRQPRVRKLLAWWKRLCAR